MSCLFSPAPLSTKNCCFTFHWAGNCSQMLPVSRGCLGQGVPQPHVPFFKSSVRISELFWRAQECVTLRGLFRRKKNLISQAGMFNSEGLAAFGSSSCIPKCSFFLLGKQDILVLWSCSSSVSRLQSCLPPTAVGKHGHKIGQFLGMYVFL